MAEPKFSTTGGANSYSPGDPNKKKLPNLPYLPGDDPTYVAPLTNTALNVPGAPQQPQVQPVQQQPQQNNVVNQQRNQAMSNILTQANQPQQPSQVQQSVNTQTQNLLNNPTQGWNGEQYKQTQLSNFDDEQAKLFEAMRQKFADTADTGIFRKDALGNQLQTLKDRRTLGSDIDYENRDYQRQAIIDSLAQGRETEGMNQAVKNNVVDNLAKAIQSGEGEAQRAADTTAREDTQQFNRGERISKQDYDAQQAELDRQAAIALQNGDIAGQEKIANLKSVLDLKYLGQQQTFTGQESALDRSLQLTLKNMDTDAQKAITTLKGQIDQNLQISDQTWQSAEEAINRQQELALQNNDINAAINLETIKSQLQEQYQQNREAFQNSQRELSQIYNTNERLDTQNYETNMKYLDNDLYAIRSQGDAAIEKDLRSLDAQIEDSKANKDVERTKILESYKAQLEADAAKTAFANTKEAMTLQAQIDEAAANNDQTRVVELENLKAQQSETFAKNRAAEATLAAQKKFDYDWLMQNNDYGHDEKMARLGAELEEAKANGDVTREQQLMTLQLSIDFQKMQREYGYESAIENLRGSIASAASSQDFVQATALKAQEINATVEENAKDRAIQLSELALQQDQATYQRYEVMSQTDPEGAAKYLKAELAKKGITYNPVDAVEQAKKAVLADFEVAKEQYKVTHSGSLEGFNEFYNSSMYGEKTQEDYIDQIVSGQFNYQQLKADPEKLAAAKENAMPWNQSAYKNKEGKNIMQFNTMPEMNVPFKTEYGSFVRISDPTRKVEFGADRQQFQAINLINGKVTTFAAY